MTFTTTDVRAAARSLRRSPGFVAMTVAVLAVGLGVAVAVFVAVDAVLFRSLPLPPAEQGLVVRVLATDPAEPGKEWDSTSYPVFADYQAQARSFAQIAAFSDGVAFDVVADAGSSGGARAERIEGGVVSGTFFEIFAAQPALGRLFSASDDVAPGGHPVVVLGNGYWRRRFGADPGVLGATLRLNGQPYTVIGVARRDFVGPSFAARAQLWVPMAMANQAMPAWSADMNVLESRNFSWMETIGRLRPGVSPAAAQAELEAIARARAATQPKDDYDPSAKLVPAAGTGFGVDAESQAAVARPARVLSVLVGLVLGIACANAAGLLLARGERRRAEIALRLCLGASRRRVVGQLVVEGVTLAVAAAVAGFGVAALLLGFLSRFAEGLPLPIGDLDPFAEPRVLLFAAALALVCGVAFSLAPATHVVAPVAARLAAALRGADRAGRARWSGRGLLIVGQVALSTALLIGSLLLVRSLRAAARFDLGFEPRGAAIATVDLATQGYKSDRGRRAWDEILASVRSTPGVAEAAIGKSVPVQSSGMRATMKPEGYVFAPGESEHVNYNIVSPQYFATLRHPLLSGREFSSEDRRDGAGVAIVNRAFAERFWGKTENAASWLGRRVADIGPGLGAEIVGVVENAAQRSVREAPAPALYVPLAQSYMSGMTIVARAAPGFDAAALPAAIGRAVARFDPNLPVFRTRTLEEHLGVTLAQERASAALFGTFALLAIGLVASGLYSLVAFTTLRRWREIGLRVALGARERQVLALALREAAILAGSGATLGVLLALGLGRALESQLFGVGPTDPPSLLVAALLLIAVALAAGFGPARRAARMNPSAALRSE